MPSPLGTAAKSGKRHAMDDFSKRSDGPSREEDYPVTRPPTVSAVDARAFVQEVGTNGANEPAPAPDAPSTPEEASTLLATTVLNKLICKYSRESALVMTNLPMPGESQSPVNYMQQVDTLVESLPLCMLIMGQKNSDVVTMYS